MEPFPKSVNVFKNLLKKKIRKGEALLFFWFFKNYELIRDSSLWRSNFIPLVHDSIIIIGSRSVVYTFDLRFTYKRWVRVLSKIWILAFLGKYSNIVCWVSKCVDWGSHHSNIVCWVSMRVDWGSHHLVSEHRF